MVKRPGMRVRAGCLALLAAGCAGARGQIIQMGPRPAGGPTGPTGTVTGHVYCGDTHLPARLASVVLQPVVTPDVLPGKKNTGGPGSDAAMSTVEQTQMDGSYTISHVAPGEYYVIAELAGYVSPLAVFTRDALNHPTKETADLMAALLTPVTVTANNSSRGDVSLVRGATIGGAVRFEDGAPDEGSTVAIMRRAASGAWQNFSPSSMRSLTVITDDQGRFRFAGLPAGEYLLNTNLAIAGTRTTYGDVFSQSIGMGYPTYGPSWLKVYFGAAFRERDGKSITVAGAETLTGEDIEIPLSRLHSVSGTVVDASTGAAVSQATVRILFTELGTHGGAASVGRTDVGKDGTFQFPFVPDGSYKLTVGSAREVSEEMVPLQIVTLPGGDSIRIVGQPAQVPMRMVQTVQKTYVDASQVIVVHGDMSGVVVQVMANPPVAAGK